MRSRHTKENFGFKTLGVFFGKGKANRCAREHIREEFDEDFER